jgi:hypothetical protein
MQNTFWRCILVAPTIEQIVKNGGTVIVLETIGTDLTVSVAGDPTSLTGIAGYGMVEAYMYGDEYNNELFRVEPQGNA